MPRNFKPASKIVGPVGRRHWSAEALERGDHLDRHTRYDRTRSGLASRAWYASAEWKALRAEVLAAARGRCARCGGHATLVDHREPHREDAALFWNRSNLQALCRICHGLKTADEGPAVKRAQPRPRNPFGIA